MDRYVGKVVYPDWYVESINTWIRTFILICMLIRSYVAYLQHSDRYVVSPAVFLTAAWSHLHYS